MFAAPVILVIAGTIGADTNPVIIVPLESFATLKMTPVMKPKAGPRPIRLVQADVADVLEVLRPPGIDQATLLLSGKKLGKTKVTLTDVLGTKETYEVIVAREILVPTTVPLLWEWPEGQRIKTIYPAAGKELKIALIQVDDKDARRIRINPVAEGHTFFALSDGGDTAETVSLRIQKPTRMITVGEKLTMQPYENWVVRWVQVTGTRNIGFEWTRGHDPDHSQAARRVSYRD